MPEHTVRRGDTLLRIAEHHGHSDWRTIYEHPANAALREARPDPSLLVEGDRVFVPEVVRREEEVSLDARHFFRYSAPKAVCRIAVQDESGESLAGGHYELTIDGELTEGEVPATGVLELDIGLDPKRGTLRVWQTEPERELVFHLALGHLEPVDTVAGALGRLSNLGFDVGSAARSGDALDDKTQAAIRAFQIVAALDITGELNDATRAALVDAHDL